MTTSRQVLVVRHLPSELSDADKEDLLRHFGAISVKVISSKKNPFAFAKFETEAKARNVLFRLHQLEVLGSRLVVEYAKEAVNLADPRFDKVTAVKTEPEVKKEYYKEFLAKLNAWNSAVDFHQPPPPHLKYAYPRPNVATINNIAHALASVPKFYTQVLHLMNKMNLPPPFSNIPDPPELQLQPPPPVHQSSEESELESDPENVEKIDGHVPVKRALPQKKHGLKRPKFINPVTQGQTSQKTTQSNDAFEKVDLETGQKRIEVKVVSESVDNIKRSNQEVVGTSDDGGFTKMHAHKVVEKRSVRELTPELTRDVITERELAANRISDKDHDHLPVFKNYHPGVPSCRLYIKNLSKNVTINDLNYVYKRYLDPTIEPADIFDIRLMQEGRMKGQAFVTLQNMELAQKALTETNGYLMKDKPIVVVYARSAKSKT